MMTTTSQLSSELKAMVIDNGSTVCRAGLAGDDRPLGIFPSLVGQRRYNKDVITSTTREPAYCGEQVEERHGIFRFFHPIEGGIIQDWERMQDLWAYAISNVLHVQPEEYNAILTEPPMNPKVNKEKMAQIFFEKFDVPALYIGVQPVLALFASGRGAGLMVVSGEGSTYTVAVHEGQIIPQATNRIKLGGTDLTRCLAKIVSERGWNFFTRPEMDILRNVKEKLCFVALDFNAAMKQCVPGSPQLDESYELPDGQKMTLGNERFRCPELLFTPALDGREAEGIHKLVLESIMHSDIDLRQMLYRNVILSGGSTVFPGLPERLRAELQKLVPNAITVGVCAPPDRALSTWIGGSIVGSLDSFRSAYLNREEYEEGGPATVHSKFLQIWPGVQSFVS